MRPETAGGRGRAAWLSGRLTAWIWLACVLAVTWQQWNFWRTQRLETDLFALLPSEEREADVEKAARVLAEGVARQIVVLVGAPTWEEARLAGADLDARWQSLDDTLLPGEGIGATAVEQATDALAPWRDRLLTPEQWQRLSTASAEELSQQALATLYQPGFTSRLSSWTADPLGLWPQWWLQRAAQSPVRMRDGALGVEGDGMQWVVLSRETKSSGFALDGRARHAAALDEAEAAARATHPSLQVLRAGVPLHAEAAAAQATKEVNIIGWGSLAAILLLMWLAFHSLRPILCVMLSLVVGCATALAVTSALFDKVHLITVVFGATLIGVAEDYGIHFFASYADSPGTTPRALLRHLRPGMLLALVTSVLAYLTLALVPFPGLRQMAVFSASGLIAAFLTVLWWFPELAGKARGMTAFARAISNGLPRWPRWPRGQRGAVLGVLVLVLLCFPLLHLHARDDVRQLQSSPAALVQSQIRVQTLLRWPSPGQFFLVTGANPEELLQREERLVAALTPLAAAGALRGWTALSDWVPSLARQRAAAELTARTETPVLARVSELTGERLQRPEFTAPDLTVEDALAKTPAQALRSLWLGELTPGRFASVVLLSGVEPAQLAKLAQLGDMLKGVHWVDRVGRMTALLARHRVAMSWLLAAGFVAVGIVLLTRYRRDAWRAWVPTLLACLITLHALVALHAPLQLFNVLALIIVLGIGVDYGIFLVEHRSGGAAWLSIVLGAASTWLSFGLLALSSTPALSAFGLTLAIGIGSVTLLSPLFRPDSIPPTSGVNVGGAIHVRT